MCYPHNFTQIDKSKIFLHFKTDNTIQQFQIVYRYYSNTW